MVAINPQNQPGAIPMNLVQEAKKQTHVKKMVGDTRQKALAEGAFDMMQMIHGSLKEAKKQDQEYIQIDFLEKMIRDFYKMYTS